MKVLFELVTFKAKGSSKVIDISPPAIHRVTCMRCGHDQAWCLCTELLTALIRLPVRGSSR